MNWAELSWANEERRVRRAIGKPPNRRMVEIVTCPTCQGEHIRCHKRTPVVSHWACLAEKNCPDWKEGPAVGEAGRAHLA
jgi:hypothetical protein